MRVQLYELNHGECPYLPDRTWVTHSFRADWLPAGVYDRLIDGAWRRSGRSFYRNHCPGCSLCIPIRVSPERFKPSKSQRRTIRRNRDVEVRWESLDYDEEVYGLYARYSRERHQSDASKKQYLGFLGTTPIETGLMTYYVADRLVGVGWIDVLDHGLSSVYFAFDPGESERSLGTYSVIREIEEVRALGKQWLYLGFYVPESRKMSYKASYRPHQLLIDETWVEGTDELHRQLRERAHGNSRSSTSDSSARL